MPDRKLLTKRDIKHELMNALNVTTVGVRRLDLTKSKPILEALVESVKLELENVDFDETEEK